MKTRRKFTSEFKSKVALEALQEREPIHEIAKRYEVHPAQVTQWKKALQAGAGSVFEKQGEDAGEEIRRKQKEDRLYKQIGHLQVQVDFLKEIHRKCGIPQPEGDLDRFG